MNNIILIGFMGSGKSSTARFLSKHYNLKFIDTDRIVEKNTGMTIKDIFQNKSEGFFRDAERRVISTHLRFCSDCVIATGGGMPCFFDNISELKKIGWVVWLNIDFEDILNRITNKANRPLLSDINKAKNLYNKRISCYSKAHFTIDANKPIDWVANQIVKNVGL